MLVLGRKVREAVCIGSDVKVTVSRIDRDGVRLSIDAPREVPIFREELLTGNKGGKAKEGLRGN